MRYSLHSDPRHRMAQECQMYKLTWKHALVELGTILLMMYLVTAGCAAGWYIVGLRNGSMMLWALLIVVPTSLAPFGIWKFAYERKVFQDVARGSK